MRAWLLALAVLAACKVRDPPPVTSRWADHFDRDRPGTDYYRTDDDYAVEHGALATRGPAGYPLWLHKKLPHDVRIEFDCWTDDPRGDLRVQLFGDGRAFDAAGGRTIVTGYALVFGGWGNTRSLIARLDQRGKELAERAAPQVIAHHRYHWKIERSGTKVTWWIDDPSTPFLVLDDPHPLEGAGHEYFAFDHGDTDTWFDDLVITPL